MRRMVLAVSSFALALPVIPVTPAFGNHNGYYHGRTWRDSQGRIRCRRPNGTIGRILIQATPGGPYVAPPAEMSDVSAREIARSRRRCR